MGHSGSGGLERRTLDVAGVRRTYWLARGPGTDGQSERLPLLIVLHGSGTSGRDVATTSTGLATRGPAAGVTVVFPDGWRGVWHVMGAPARQPDLDDGAFLRALTSRLQGAEPRPVVLAGISNGAGFAEHVARHGDLPSQRLIVPVETVARDWAAGNGITGEPASTRLPGQDTDPPVVRLS